MFVGNLIISINDDKKFSYRTTSYYIFSVEPTICIIKICIIQILIPQIVGSTEILCNIIIIILTKICIASLIIIYQHVDFATYNNVLTDINWGNQLLSISSFYLIGLFY